MVTFINDLNFLVLELGRERGALKRSLEIRAAEGLFCNCINTSRVNALINVSV